MINPLSTRPFASAANVFRHHPGESPSIFNKGFGPQVMDWAMQNEPSCPAVGSRICCPTLYTSEHLTPTSRRLHGRRGRDNRLLSGAEKSACRRVPPSSWARPSAATTKAWRQFIVGETTRKRQKPGPYPKDGFAFTVDLLGEATVSEGECDAYRDGYLEVLRALAKEQAGWKALGGASGDLDWGSVPKVNASIKPSALYSQANPMNFEGSEAASSPCARSTARSCPWAAPFASTWSSCATRTSPSSCLDACAAKRNSATTPTCPSCSRPISRIPKATWPS